MLVFITIIIYILIILQIINYSTNNNYINNEEKLDNLNIKDQIANQKIISLYEGAEKRVSCGFRQNKIYTIVFQI